MDPARSDEPKDRLSLEAAGYTRKRVGIKRYAGNSGGFDARA
jgi:hypothetical protein